MATAVQLIVKYALWLYLFCAVGALLYLRAAAQARRERDRALFTLEREMASSRTLRYLLVALLFLMAGGSVFAVERYVAPALESSEPQEIAEVPTVFLISTPTSAFLPPTVTPTATATTRPRPTRTPAPTASPTVAPTPVPQPPPCPNPGARIISPGVNARLSGLVPIRGSAYAADFQFYKVEFASTSNLDHWSSISEVHRNQVSDGVLDVWNTDLLPPGDYILRLTIVDITGNYPPQNICEVPVTIVR